VAGLDIGSAQHWVCGPARADGAPNVRVFGTTTDELHALADWLGAGLDPAAVVQVQIEQDEVDAAGICQQADRIFQRCGFQHFCPGVQGLQGMQRGVADLPLVFNDQESHGACNRKSFEGLRSTECASWISRLGPTE